MRLINADELYTDIAVGEIEIEESRVAEVAVKVYRDVILKRLAASPTVDSVPVVRCKDCVSHGNCLTEDTFKIAWIENPYCCGGKRKEKRT